MVNLIRIFAKFMKEINSEFGFLNFGGRLNEKIRKKLHEDKVLPPDKIHSKGYHMSTLGTCRCPSWEYAMQQLDCMQFVMSMDQFLSQFFGFEFGSILDSHIRDPLLTFVVEINPDTLQESEASREKKANIAKEWARQLRKERYLACLQHLREKYASMTLNQRAAFNARRYQRCAQMTSDQQTAYNAHRHQRCAQMTVEQQNEHNARRHKRYHAMTPEKQAAYLAQQKAYRDGCPPEKKEQQLVQWILAKHKCVAEWSTEKTEAIQQKEAIWHKNWMEEQNVKATESKQKSAAKLKARKFEVSTTEPTEKDILTGSGYGKKKRAGNIWYDDFMNKKYVVYSAIDERKHKSNRQSFL